MFACPLLIKFFNSVFQIIFVCWQYSSFFRRNCWWVFIFKLSCVISFSILVLLYVCTSWKQIYFPLVAKLRSRLAISWTHIRGKLFELLIQPQDMPNLLTSFKSCLFRRYILFNFIKIDCVFISKNPNNRKSG